MLWGQIIAVPEPCPSADFLGAERTPSCGHGGLAPRPGGAGEAFPHAGHGTLPYFPTPSISPQNNPPSHIPGSQRTPSRAGGRLFSQSPAHELTSPSANPRRCNWDVSDIQVKTKPTSSCFAFLRRNHLFPQILFRLLKAIGCSRAPRTSWGAWAHGWPYSGDPKGRAAAPPAHAGSFHPWVKPEARHEPWCSSGRRLRGAARMKNPRDPCPEKKQDPGVPVGLVAGLGESSSQQTSEDQFSACKQSRQLSGSSAAFQSNQGCLA